MSNILKTITNHKKQELIKRKKTTPLTKLVVKLKSSRPQKSNFLKSLQKPTDNISLIAEIKLHSPSAGHLGDKQDIVKRALAYQKAGADALSVITDHKFFHGQISFIKKIKRSSSLPILQKDFVIDLYQLYEAKLAGADALLLITKIVKPDKLRKFVDLAYQLGLEPVVEVTNKKELQTALKTPAVCIGVNARNLKDFSVDINQACQLAKLIPQDKIFIGFSGIKTKQDVQLYQKAGAKAVLIGTSLMKAQNINKFIKDLKNL